MASTPGSDQASSSDPLHREQIEGERAGAVVTTIVEAIAAVRGVDPIDLDLRLDEHVDTDALEHLYRHAQENREDSWRVQVRVDEFVVGVRSDGIVTIT